MEIADKFNLWLGIYKMEDYAPELVPGFEAIVELLDYMKPSKAEQEFLKNVLDKP